MYVAVTKGEHNEADAGFPTASKKIIYFYCKLCINGDMPLGGGHRLWRIT